MGMESNLCMKECYNSNPSITSPPLQLLNNTILEFFNSYTDHPLKIPK